MEQKWRMIVAAVLGILAVTLAYVYWQQREARLQVEEVSILVAAKDITKGAVIDYDMLAFQHVPVNFVQPGALGSRESAAGKTAEANMMAGEQILSTKLAAPGSGLTLAGKTPPGKRAATIALDTASAVGGMTMPGDHVDVLAIFTTPAMTITLFQDVLVLAVGQRMVPAPEGRGRRGDQPAAPMSRQTVTLALSPQEVQILTVAMEQGKIRLTLRPRMETEEPLPAVDLSNLPLAIDFNTLLQFYIRRAPPGPSVEVIRGLEKEITPIPTGR